jgi:hypothetical protein
MKKILILSILFFYLCCTVDNQIVSDLQFKNKNIYDTSEHLGRTFMDLS